MAEYALFVGVNEYPRDLSMPPLRYAEVDATELWSTFKHLLGYGERAVLLRAPHALTVLETFDEFGKRVRSGDTFVFYFAGHGFQLGGDQYLLMPNANLGKLKRGDVNNNDVLSLRSLLDDVASWKGQAQALCLLDACRTVADTHGARADQRLEANVQGVLSALACEPTVEMNSRDVLISRQQDKGAQTATAGTPLRPIIMNACPDGGQAYEIGGSVRRGVFSLALQQHAETHVKDRRPWVLTAQSVEELAQLMQQGLPEQFRDRVQRPWLSRDATSVKLWWPANDVSPTHPASTKSVQAGLHELDDQLWRLAQLQAPMLGAPAYESYLRTASSVAKHVNEAIEAIAALKTVSASAAFSKNTKPINRSDEATPSKSASPSGSGGEPRNLAGMGRGFRFRDAPWAPEMIVVTAGHLDMGSPVSERRRSVHEGPTRKVHVRRAFGLGRYAVTFDEYDRYAIEIGLELPSDAGWGRGMRPVINVSWADAQKFIEWLNKKLKLDATTGFYRLPSEAEWEYAARAGTTTAYWWGDKVNTGKANYNGMGGDFSFLYPVSLFRHQTVRVDKLRPNWWGLYCMNGNVQEWVQDQWHANYDGAPATEQAWEDSGGGYAERVLRGGSWMYPARESRSASRAYDGEWCFNESTGFRLARTL